MPDRHVDGHGGHRVNNVVGIRDHDPRLAWDDVLQEWICTREESLKWALHILALHTDVQQENIGARLRRLRSTERISHRHRHIHECRLCARNRLHAITNPGAVA